MTPLGAGAFRRLVADVDYPALGTVGRFSLTTRDQWQAALPRLGPSGRGSVLKALEPALLQSTPGGAARWKTWHAAPDTLPDLPRPELASYIRDRVLLVGDDAALDLIVDGLLLVPKCVLDVIITEVAFVAVGFTSRGWTTGAHLVDGRDAGPKTRLIALGPHAGSATVAHESCHCWLRPPVARVDDAVGRTCQANGDVRRHLARAGRLEAHDHRYAREERIVTALVSLWLERR